MTVTSPANLVFCT